MYSSTVSCSFWQISYNDRIILSESHMFPKVWSMHLSNTPNNMFMPPVMSECIYQDNLEGYQKCGDACSLHHTDPAIPVHQSARSHESHPHWHMWSEIWVDSILLVPVFFSPAGIFNDCGLHLTHWLLNSHLNQLHQDILVKKVVSLPLHLLESVSPLLGICAVYLH